MYIDDDFKELEDAMNLRKQTPGIAPSEIAILEMAITNIRAAYIQWLLYRVKIAVKDKSAQNEKTDKEIADTLNLIGIDIENQRRINNG